jgi:large subunit ribosomal protein L4
MELETTIFSVNGEKKGKVNLPSSVFSFHPNRNVMYDVLRMYEANKRQGTASTKERTEVRGGGRKPFRQKHTGRARAGTIRSPLWRGGGVVFGPKPRDFSYKVPKKTRRLAIRSAFSLKRIDGSVKVVDFIEFEEPKTKRLNGILTTLGLGDKKVLFLIDSYSKNLFLSARNIPDLRISLAKDANASDIVWADVLLITAKSIQILHEVFHG